MSTDGAGSTDEVLVELNPPVLAEATAVGRRPAPSAAKPTWVDYAVGLGASRDSITGGTKHWDADVEQYVALELTKDALIELADRLGG